MEFPRKLAPVIANESAAEGIPDSAVNAGDCQRSTVAGCGMIDPRKIDRPIRANCIEFPPRWIPLLLQAVDMPTLASDHPEAIGIPDGVVMNGVEDVGNSPAHREVHEVLLRPGRQHMVVAVDKSGKNRSRVELPCPCRTGKNRAHFAFRSDTRDPPCNDAHRVGARPARIHRDQVAGNNACLSCHGGTSARKPLLRYRCEAKGHPPSPSGRNASAAAIVRISFWKSHAYSLSFGDLIWYRVRS